MKQNLTYSFLVLAAIMVISCQPAKRNLHDRTSLFDDNWRFIKGDPAGAENPEFDDSNWRLLDLPHDWSIEDLPNQSDSVKGPFSKSSPGKMRTGYTLGGTAWYRKTFSIEPEESDQIAYLMFDGVYMNSDIWINGKHLGSHPYGYTSFYFDVTPYLNPAGEPNVVAVRVRNEGENARWYSGSGIYRHTWLTLVDTIHTGIWGTYVQSQSVDNESAEVTVTSAVVNSGQTTATANVQVELISTGGTVSGSAESEVELPPGGEREVTQMVRVLQPELWSLEDPKLYMARVTIAHDGKVTDISETPFGIRSVEISADKGLLLNGEPIELVGGCFHHDNGPLGAKAIDRAEERKIELFKNNGYNAIRCSHNPPSPYLLDVCDRMGMLVINEIFDNWEDQKVSEDDYSLFFKAWWQKDVEMWVKRDRNHPSVIMWSIGNEIHEALDTAGLRIAGNLTGAIRSLDDTRAITEGFNDFARMRGGHSRWHESAPHMELLDVVGYNYMYDRYVEDHELYPERVMVATEFMPLFSLVNWKTVVDHSYVIGNFAWVVMDYLGEAGVGLSRIVPDVPRSGRGMLGGGFFSRDSWPVFNDFQGDIDLIGNKKPRYFHQLVVWGKSDIEMMVHEPVPDGMRENVSPWGWPNELKCWNWNGHEGEKMKVNVYTRSPLIRLELNGELIGEKAVEGDTSITASFEVPYEPGVLVARAFDQGVETGSDTIRTVGEPVAVRLVADRTEIDADRNDLAYVMAEIVDSEGNLVPNADSVLVNFTLEGDAEIAGVGSGSPLDMASFQQPRRRTWHGKCLAIVRPTGTDAGTIILKAEADGLAEAVIEISSRL